MKRMQAEICWGGFSFTPGKVSLCYVPLPWASWPSAELLWVESVERALQCHASVNAIPVSLNSHRVTSLPQLPCTPVALVYLLSPFLAGAPAAFLCHPLVAPADAQDC
ncbi:hypothetical protein KIL84_016001 [Mauremys mutica]|uniref:Uncharacterized protein n=1 Tax=Mauremys mutica TaxID=74926 RepID=A0A9D4AQC6_9SAUR|nr:hypothetical protein KIL84_016001 [Mauremys mutica]